MRSRFDQVVHYDTSAPAEIADRQAAEAVLARTNSQQANKRVKTSDHPVVLREVRS